MFQREDGSSMVPQNAGILPYHCMASQLRRPQPESSNNEKIKSLIGVISVHIDQIEIH
jgi:hypothetical protein